MGKALTAVYSDLEVPPDSIERFFQREQSLGEIKALKIIVRQITSELCALRAAIKETVEANENIT